jgi:hypothetical protein
MRQRDGDLSGRPRVSLLSVPLRSKRIGTVMSVEVERAHETTPVIR